ncbi:hypothetical protein ACVMFB_002645 [Bradyrhizobium sp. USDA 4522]
MTTAAALRADVPASTTSVYTGAEFLDSIQDGREIYIYGERVKIVTQHPAPSAIRRGWWRAGTTVSMRRRIRSAS